MERQQQGFPKFLHLHLLLQQSSQFDIEDPRFHQSVYNVYPWTAGMREFREKSAKDILKTKSKFMPALKKKKRPWTGKGEGAVSLH